MLRKTLIDTFGKTQFQSPWIKLRDKRHDIENANLRYSDRSGSREALVGSLRNNLLGFTAGHTESQLSARVWCTPFVTGISKLKDVTTAVGAIHSQPIGEFFNRYKFIVCHDLVRKT